MKVVEAHEVKQRIMAYAFFERGYSAVVTEGLNNADVVGIKGRDAYEFEIKVSRSDLNKELAAIEYAQRHHRGERLGLPDTPEQAQINLELGALRNKGGGWSKLSKHEQYIDPKAYFEEHSRYMLGNRYMPNFFYMVVPNRLVAYTIEKLEGTGYGVIAYDGCRSEGQHYGFFKDGKWYEHPSECEDAVWTKGAPCTFGSRGCYEEVAVKRKALRIHRDPIDDQVIYSVLSRACAENIRMMREIIELNERLKDAA